MLRNVGVHDIFWNPEYTVAIVVTYNGIFLSNFSSLSRGYLWSVKTVSFGVPGGEYSQSLQWK